jgi:hypothetical protein
MTSPTVAASPFTGLGRRAYSRESDLDQAAPVAVVHPTTGEPVKNKTEAMRAHLRERGRANGAQLAALAGVKTTSLVSALLKNDIKAGRVSCACGWFEWKEVVDEQLASRLTEAAALLRRNGYRVEKDQA